jgi:IS5 family transposase
MRKSRPPLYVRVAFARSPNCSPSSIWWPLNLHTCLRHPIKDQRAMPRGAYELFHTKWHRPVIHSLTCTAGNVSDISQTAELLHGEERYLIADAGHTGVEKREEMENRTDLQYLIAEKRNKIEKLPEGSLREASKELEKSKAGNPPEN